MSPAASLLRIDRASFGYRGERLLLEGFELSVAPGEFLALLGPSGCGKSTILNLAAGLLVPLEGGVGFAGRPVRGVNTQVGYMTQGDTLLPWLTVARNIRLPLTLRGVPAAERGPRVDRVLEMVGLTAARDRWPAQLSGGMRRRALLARSIVYDPPMLLMDEPFAALDAQLREDMHAELLAMVARTGQGVLFVTHDIGECLMLADRVVVLGGRPLRIMDDLRLPWAGPGRDLEAVRQSPERAALERHLRAAIRAADAAVQAEAGITA
jgi:NitT/TauT family transport system ATP-binding protein